MASSFVAVFDACGLYPAPVRDLLMRRSVTGLFRARWTELLDGYQGQGLATTVAALRSHIDKL